MRISDWSSDVCSSDLPQRSDERLDRLLVLERLDDCDHPFDIDAVAGEGGQLSDRNRTPGIAVDGIGAIEARRRSVVEGQLDLLTLDSEGVVFAGGLDRKSVVEGKSVSGRVDLGGRRHIKKKTQRTK